MPANNQPTHSVYCPEGDGDDVYWGEPIGAAWPHKDGDGFNLVLKRVPVAWDGKLVVRRRKAKDADQS